MCASHRHHPQALGARFRFVHFALVLLHQMTTAPTTTIGAAAAGGTPNLTPRSSVGAGMGSAGASGQLPSLPVVDVETAVELLTRIHTVGLMWFSSEMRFVCVTKCMCLCVDRCCWVERVGVSMPHELTRPSSDDDDTPLPPLLVSTITF